MDESPQVQRVNCTKMPFLPHLLAYECLQEGAHQYGLPEQQENFLHGEVGCMAAAKFGHHPK